MKARRTFLVCLLLSILSSHSFAERMGSTRGSGDSTGWSFSPAINGGYNNLLDGYDGYDNLGNLGLDLYMQPGPVDERDSMNSWRNTMLFRLSVDWFPLQVPDGVYGLKEDIYSLNGSFLYAFRKNQAFDPTAWRPFLGAGIGYYRDIVELDTPATGKITGKDNHFGFNFNAGLFYPFSLGSLPLCWIPEVRYHRIKYVDEYSGNITYQLGLAYWPRLKRGS